ncbi:hypothetical protein BGZ83_002761, partial [Gryganskiella cystojenkinii]
VKKQLMNQVLEETLFCRVLQQSQEQVRTFEAHIIKEAKQILATFAQYQVGHANSGFGDSWSYTEASLDYLQPDSEWNEFMARYGHRFLPSHLVDANPDELAYPGSDDKFVAPIKSSHMARQSTVLKAWRNGYFVLTEAGWLHMFGTDDVSTDSMPSRSIYLPTAILGPHQPSGKKYYSFSVEGKGMSGLFHRDTQTFTVRSAPMEEIMSWWFEISVYTKSRTIMEQRDDGVKINALSRSGTWSKSASDLRSRSSSRRPSMSIEPPLQQEQQQFQRQQQYQQQGDLPPYIAQGYKTEYSEYGGKKSGKSSMRSKLRRFGSSLSLSSKAAQAVVVDVTRSSQAAQSTAANTTANSAANTSTYMTTSTAAGMAGGMAASMAAFTAANTMANTATSMQEGSSSSQIMDPMSQPLAMSRTDSCSSYDSEGSDYSVRTTSTQSLDF